MWLYGCCPCQAARLGSSSWTGIDGTLWRFSAASFTHSHCAYNITVPPMSKMDFLLAVIRQVQYWDYALTATLRFNLALWHNMLEGGSCHGLQARICCALFHFLLIFKFSTVVLLRCSPAVTHTHTRTGIAEQSDREMHN